MGAENNDNQTQAIEGALCTVLWAIFSIIFNKPIKLGLDEVDFGAIHLPTGVKVLRM